MAATDISIGSDGPPAKKAKTEINCEQCGTNKSKYTCPKCGFRTCSLPCVKLHKDSSKCDGQREKFDVVKKESQFNDETSIKDQVFLAGVTEGLVTGMKRAKNVTKTVIEQKNQQKMLEERKIDETMEKIKTEIKEECKEDGNSLMMDESIEKAVKLEECHDDGMMDIKQEVMADSETPNMFDTEENEQMETSGSQNLEHNNTEEQVENSETSSQKSETNKNVQEENDEESYFLKKYGTRQPGEFSQGLTQNERNLISNVIRRRIFIEIKTPSEADGSFHEHFSDTIFWTIEMRFLKEIPGIVGQNNETDGQDFVMDSNGEETTQID
uniref:HIT-type domain-containing protein n=1 Tax=Panagrolaimus sp. JU765 TaxID=591449 RepID=A0AC34Q516_9BILA